MKPRESNGIHIYVLRYKYNSVSGVHIPLKTTFLYDAVVLSLLLLFLMLSFFLILEPDDLHCQYIRI